MARSLKAAQLRSATSSAEVEETAAAIIAAVRTRGDDCRPGVVAEHGRLAGRPGDDVEVVATK